MSKRMDLLDVGLYFATAPQGRVPIEVLEAWQRVQIDYATLLRKEERAEEEKKNVTPIGVKHRGPEGPEGAAS